MTLFTTRSMLLDLFLKWVSTKGFLSVVTQDTDKQILLRYQPFWLDEYVIGEKHYHRPPWWRPFNILIHQWKQSSDEGMHDHPRWSITIVLKGSLIEKTPWGNKKLTPGSVVIRSHKAIHSFEVCEENTWTMFIVGRRNHKQNGYTVTPVK